MTDSIPNEGKVTMTSALRQAYEDDPVRRAVDSFFPSRVNNPDLNDLVIVSQALRERIDDMTDDCALEGVAMLDIRVEAQRRQAADVLQGIGSAQYLLAVNMDELKDNADAHDRALRTALLRIDELEKVATQLLGNRDLLMRRWEECCEEQRRLYGAYRMLREEVTTLREHAKQGGCDE